MNKNFSFFKIIFYIASFGSLIAGISEIIAVRHRQLNNLPQNIWTPILLMCVKFLLIPYYWLKVTERGDKPTRDPVIISKFVAGIIWLVAVGYATNIF